MNYSPPSPAPTPTRTKRETAFARSIDWGKVAAKGKEKASDLVIPGVDLAAMRRRFGPDTFGHPVAFKGDFTVPIEYGNSGPNYERVRNDAIKTFLAQMGKQGLEFYADNSHPFRVYPGVYPAWDVGSQSWDLGRRQFIVEAYFRSLKPKPIAFELDPRLVDETRITRGSHSPRKG